MICQVIETHDEDATIRSAMNAHLLAKEGDLDGSLAWRGIVSHINELADPMPLGMIE